MPAPARIQSVTLEKFLDAWKKWNAQEWLAIFDEDFTQVTLPFGLGIPARTREHVEQVLPALVATVKSYELTVHNVVHDVVKNKAAIYASSKGSLPWGEEWEMEYSAFITFSEQGDKVRKLEEMLDSAILKDFGPKFGEYLHSNGGPAAVAAAGGGEGVLEATAGRVVA